MIHRRSLRPVVVSAGADIITSGFWMSWDDFLGVYSRKSQSSYGQNTWCSAYEAQVSSRSKAVCERAMRGP